MKSFIATEKEFFNIVEALNVNLNYVSYIKIFVKHKIIDQLPVRVYLYCFPKFVVEELAILEIKHSKIVDFLGACSEEVMQDFVHSIIALSSKVSHASQNKFQLTMGDHEEPFDDEADVPK